jgi:hypothetical protein
MPLHTHTHTTPATPAPQVRRSTEHDDRLRQLRLRLHRLLQVPRLAGGRAGGHAPQLQRQLRVGRWRHRRAAGAPCRLSRAGPGGLHSCCAQRGAGGCRTSTPPARTPTRSRCFEVKCAPTDFADGYGQSLPRAGACYDPDASVVIAVTDTCEAAPRRWGRPLAGGARGAAAADADADAAAAAAAALARHPRAGATGCC